MLNMHLFFIWLIFFLFFFLNFKKKKWNEWYLEALTNLSNFIFIFLILLSILFYFNSAFVETLLIFISVIPFTLQFFYYFKNRQRKPEKFGSYFSMLSYNMNIYNQNFNELINLIKKSKPDIIILLEVNQSIRNKLLNTNLLQKYSIGLNNKERLATLVFSKFNIYKNSSFYSNSEVIDFKLIIKNKKINILAAHLFPPKLQHRYEKMKSTYNQIIKWSQNTAGKKIIVGDLNFTIWSFYFKNLIENGYSTKFMHLIFRSSWPSFSSFIGVVIDHIFVSKDLYISEIIICKKLESDHRPLLTKIYFE